MHCTGQPFSPTSCLYALHRSALLPYFLFLCTAQVSPSPHTSCFYALHRFIIICTAQVYMHCTGQKTVKILQYLFERGVRLTSNMNAIHTKYIPHLHEPSMPLPIPFLHNHIHCIDQMQARSLPTPQPHLQLLLRILLAVLSLQHLYRLLELSCDRLAFCSTGALMVHTNTSHSLVWLRVDVKAFYGNTQSLAHVSTAKNANKRNCYMSHY